MIGSADSKPQDVVWHQSSVTRLRRETQNGHKAAIVWFTGLSGAGKSTLANATEERLHWLGCRTIVLDGDNVRHGLCSDLGFSDADRRENIRRVGETAKLFVEAGVISLTAFISPFRADRDRIRRLVARGEFIEVYVKCPLEVCERRDTKGLYRRARAGEVGSFTGITSPYEEPVDPDLVLDTAHADVHECVRRTVELLRERQVLGHGASAAKVS